MKYNFPRDVALMDNMWFTKPVFHNKNLKIKDVKSKSKRRVVRLSDVGLKPHMSTMCDLYSSGTFKYKLILDEIK